ncbi:MAG: tRNA (adenosine(37)-N6)-dimethylallyltransferase MiaA [Flavobacteriales bacterium]|nr:tRNA (adenosine(37)-N6)-dimethylallyltransferase MiaA [Flavobacteriales bacterium]
MIVILGPTASGKTKLAIKLANKVNGEIISADSRQVYRRMNIGTGKDLDEYKSIPYHLIDIAEPGEEYNLFRYQRDFHKAHTYIYSLNKKPIMCGGTGMYISGILDGYQLVDIPFDAELRSSLADKKEDELIELLKSYGPLHNSTDTSSQKRLIRAIEIANYSKEHTIKENNFPPVPAKIFGIDIPRDVLKERITTRLKFRLESGMIEEVASLLKGGLTPDELKFYGLEYKFVTQYLNNEINKNDLFQKLNSAIHQYAKRQMTWFRKMEKEGHYIHWLDYKLSIKNAVELIEKKAFKA